MSASMLRNLPRTALKGQRTSALRYFHASTRRAEVYKDASVETFNKIAKESKDRLVLVDFYADWCAPCRAISPTLEKLASAESGSDIDLVKIDTDKSASFPLCEEYQVRALPTVIAFRNGQQVNQFVGALRPDDVRKFVQSL